MPLANQHLHQTYTIEKTIYSYFWEDLTFASDERNRGINILILKKFDRF
jgi:hypothetical protein